MGEQEQMGSVVEECRAYSDLMKANDLVELEVTDGDFRLKLSRGTVSSVTYVPGPVISSLPTTPPESPIVPSYHALVSPIAGMFFRSPAPSSPPFVKDGDKVAFGDVLCIVEAMKVMNEIRSDQPGVIRKILPQNGKPVSAGQELFHIDPLP